MEERKSRMFWVIDYDGRPVEHRGYECPPNDDVWWFPALGFSTAQVFESPYKAYAVAIDEACKQAAKFGALEAELKLARAALGQKP